MLRRIELEVLATVDRGDTISELATKLDHSESYLSRAVANLVEKGLVYAERDSRRKRVAPSDARAVELYRDLVRQHSHIEFPELLTGKALEVCTTSTSREPSPRSPTGATTTATRSTASSIGFAIVVSSGRPTATTSSTPTSTASTSSLENSHHLHRHRLTPVASKGMILSEDCDGFLAQAKTEIDTETFHETGLSRYQITSDALKT